MHGALLIVVVVVLWPQFIAFPSSILTLHKPQGSAQFACPPETLPDQATGTLGNCPRRALSFLLKAHGLWLEAGSVWALPLTLCESLLVA